MFASNQCQIQENKTSRAHLWGDLFTKMLPTILKGQEKQNKVFGFLTSLYALAYHHPFASSLSILVFIRPLLHLALFFGPLLLSTVLCVLALMSVGPLIDKMQEKCHGSDLRREDPEELWEFIREKSRHLCTEPRLDRRNHRRSISLSDHEFVRKMRQRKGVIPVDFDDESSEDQELDLEEWEAGRDLNMPRLKLDGVECHAEEINLTSFEEFLAAQEQKLEQSPSIYLDARTELDDSVQNSRPRVSLGRFMPALYKQVKSNWGEDNLQGEVLKRNEADGCLFCCLACIARALRELVRRIKRCASAGSCCCISVCTLEKRGGESFKHH